jgi:hypothetical protein
VLTGRQNPWCDLRSLLRDRRSNNKSTGGHCSFELIQVFCLVVELKQLPKEIGFDVVTATVMS